MKNPLRNWAATFAAVRPAQYNDADEGRGQSWGVYVRRTVLLASLIVAPPLLTGLLYFASNYLLTATSRTIDQHVILYASVAELLAFLFVAALEVRARW